MLLENRITIVTVNEGVVPDNQRREQLAFLEDVFFQLPVLIVRQRRNLVLELRVNFQIDHTHNSLSLVMLRPFVLTEKQCNILFSIFQFEQFGLGIFVLLIELRLFELRLFRSEHTVFCFQLIRTW